MYVAPGSRFDKQRNEEDNRYYHLLLLARTDEGYRNLIILSSLGYTEGFYYKPRVDWELIQKYHEGLIRTGFVSAARFPSLSSTDARIRPASASLSTRSCSVLGGYWPELQNHGIEEESVVNPALIAFSKELDVPLIATNDSHYVERDDADAQDTLICIGTGKKKNDVKRLTFGAGEFYVKSYEEMAALFPETPEALANTLTIADSCTMEMKLPGPMLPEVRGTRRFHGSAQRNCWAAILKRLEAEFAPR